MSEIRRWLSAQHKVLLSSYLLKESTQCTSSSVHLLHLVLVASSSLLAIEKRLAVLVKSQVGNDAVRWVDGDFGLLSVHLLFHEFLNMNAPSATVNFSDFAFTVLVGSTDDLDSVSIADRDGPGGVLGGKFLAQLSGHHSSAKGGWGSEVCLSRLSALAGHVYVMKIEVS